MASGTMKGSAARLTSSKVVSGVGKTIRTAISIRMIPPAAVLWALVDKKGQWSTLVVGVGILACAVMVYRMHQIWFVQIA